MTDSWHPTRCAFAHRGREDAGLDVVVVVHLYDVLARGRAQYPPDVLHEPALEGDRGDQEECVERRTVEALTDIRPGRHHQQRPITRHKACRGLLDRERVDGLGDQGGMVGQWPCAEGGDDLVVDPADPDYFRGTLRFSQ